MINAAVNDYSDVFTCNRTNSPCPYKQTKQDQGTGSRATAESSGLLHTQQAGALFWPELTAVSRHGGGCDQTRDHTNQAAFGRVQPSSCIAVWTQAEPWHSWPQRQKKSPWSVTFTSSCCFCRAMLVLCHGLCGGKGKTTQPLQPASCHAATPLYSPCAAAFLAS